MYTKMVVPVDGSRMSEAILPYARSFVDALNIPVELVQVMDPDLIRVLSDPAQGRFVDIVEGDMIRNSMAYLEGLARSFPNGSIVRCSALIGKPAEVIVEKGGADRGTLIAMATRGHSGVRRWVLGSVADKVLHATTNPLLLVSATDEGKSAGEASLKTVLVPLDGSLLAELVLSHATALAKKMDLGVVLVRVFSALGAAYIGEGYTPNLDRLTDYLRQEARDYLKGVVERLRAEGLERVSQVLLEGDAAEEIIDFARKTPVNFVAMCTHGRSGIGRWMLGSVTDRVVRHSGDPVLVIRAESKDS